MTLLKVFRTQEGWVDAEPDDVFIPTSPPMTVLGAMFICLLDGTLVPDVHRERHLAFHRAAPYPMYVDVKDAIDGT